MREFAVPSMQEILHMLRETDDEKDTSTENMVKNAENVLLEYGEVTEPDRLADAALKWTNPHVAVFLKSGGLCNHAIRRLVFEGGYRVLELQRPSLKDYAEYAQDYIAYHGFTLREEENIPEMIRSLHSYRGSLMTEQDIYEHLSRCFEGAAKRGCTELTMENLKPRYYGQDVNGRDRLSEVIGLAEVKHVIDRFLAAEAVLSEQGVKLYRNLIFSGSPGTGKSMMARLLAKCMEEQGLSNGRFVDVGRADIIGKYVGHTAAKVKDVFQKADGGVMFVDEAAFLLGDDIFVKEAVIEFVRYMELCPQTMVIFAGYPKEMEELRNCDTGFASRIKKVIPFQGYEDSELYEIFCSMAKKYGFEVENDCQRAVESYIAQLRKEKNFAYAREVRKLLEAAVEEYGLSAGRESKRFMTAALLEQAEKWLLQGERKKSGFGFGICGGDA